MSGSNILAIELAHLPPSILEKIKEDYTGCWIWEGSVDIGGYGVISWHGKAWKMHRLVWTEVRGPIRPGLMILHHCDEPRCVNPRHMELGTAQDNSDDKVDKLRQVGAPNQPNGDDRPVPKVPCAKAAARVASTEYRRKLTRYEEL